MILHRFLVVSALLSGLAQGAAAALSGYVVRVEATKVWLDFGAASGVVPGQAFSVYTDQEELKHPVTGKVLGRVEKTLATGRIVEVSAEFSVGELASQAALKPGMKAALSAGAAPQPASPAPAAPAPLAPASAETGRQARWRSPAFDFKISALAVADFNGDGALDTAVAEDNRVHFLAYPPETSAPAATFKHPSIGVDIVSLETGDLNGNGRAELFATLVNKSFQRGETVVLELTDGAWKQLADIPWVVRAYQTGGAKTLAMQQASDDKSAPLSGIKPLVYEDGRYKAGKDSIFFRRADWLFDLTKANVDGGAEGWLFHTANDRLRIEFKKGHWKTEEAYGQTPIRARFGERLLQFRPGLVQRYDGGKLVALYAVKNNASLAGLAQPFGIYSNGEIHRLAWNGVGFEKTWKASTTGYLTGLAWVDRGAGELAAAVVGTAGQSSIWVFDP